MRIIVDPGGLLDLQRALTDHWSPYAADIAIQQFRALLDDAESTNILKKVTQRAAYAVGASPRRYSSLGVGDSVGRKYYRTRTEQLLDSLSNRLEGTAWMGTPGPRPTSKLYNTEYSRVATCSPLLREFVEDLFKASAGDRTATHFVEDTPYNILAAPDLMQVFPNMRLVHVYRDFRDVLASYQRQHWGKGNLLMIARRIRSIMERWRELRVGLSNANLLEVQFEELVSDREGFLRTFLSFVQLPNRPELEKSLSLIDPARTHTGRWKRELPSELLTELDPILGPILEEYGYA